MALTTLHTAPRPRAYVAVTGPEAASYLNRMVSNEVESLEVGGSCEALLLTPKARIVAPLVVWRRAADDFLLLTEPEAGERLRRSSSAPDSRRSARSSPKSTAPRSSSAETTLW